MRLLVDTDAFCKLAVCGLLKDAVQLLGVTLTECGRLPALPHMLSRGRLRKRYGAEACDMLRQIADSIPPITPPGDAWLEKLIPIEAMDPGEVQIFAGAAQYGLMAMTGDKRALSALKDVAEFTAVLNGRIVVLEAALIELCIQLGVQKVRQHLQPLVGTDQMIKICFSNPGSDPLECLRSYFDKIAHETAPLALWTPRTGGTA